MTSQGKVRTSVKGKKLKELLENALSCELFFIEIHIYARLDPLSIQVRQDFPGHLSRQGGWAVCTSKL